MSNAVDDVEIWEGRGAVAEGNPEDPVIPVAVPISISEPEEWKNPRLSVVTGLNSWCM